MNSTSLRRYMPPALLALGLVAASRPGTSQRELAWEIQAVGMGLLAVAWLGALGAATGTALGG